MGASPYGWGTVCLESAYGIKTTDLNGCSTAYTLEGKFRQQVDIYEMNLIAARDAAVNGGAFKLGGGVAIPQQIADDMLRQPDNYCKQYPGACPPDAVGLANTYVNILRDLAASYGFDMAGNYSGARDNMGPWSGDSLHVDDLVTVPTVLTPNVISYSPSAGWRPPLDALPPSTVPTIPAYTSPSNVAATGPGNATAAAGGSDIAGTASGSGQSQGGVTTQKTVLSPSQASATQLASMKNDQTKLLFILLAVAVAVILFGRK